MAISGVYRTWVQKVAWKGPWMEDELLNIWSCDMRAAIQWKYIVPDNVIQQLINSHLQSRTTFDPRLLPVPVSPSKTQTMSRNLFTLKPHYLGTNYPTAYVTLTLWPPLNPHLNVLKSVILPMSRLFSWVRYTCGSNGEEKLILVIISFSYMYMESAQSLLFGNVHNNNNNHHHYYQCFLIRRSIYKAENISNIHFHWLWASTSGAPVISLYFLLGEQEPAYTPQVEAISPTLPTEDSTNRQYKEELLQSISKLEGEITSVEQQIQKLKKKEVRAVTTFGCLRKTRIIVLTLPCFCVTQVFELRLR